MTTHERACNQNSVRRVQCIISSLETEIRTLNVANARSISIDIKRFLSIKPLNEHKLHNKSRGVRKLF